MQLQNDRDDTLEKLQSHLLLFESQLRKGQKEVLASLQDKDRTLKRQHQLILALATALTRRGGQKDLQELIPNLKLDNILSDTKGSSDSHIINKDKERSPSLVITSLKSDLESLNDSDSAIMLEDNFDSLVYIPLGKGEVKVMRSVSDAVECVTRSTGSSIYRPSVITSSMRSTQSHKSNNSSGCDPSSSLSTTPSCSSEEGDGYSPASTISKGRREIMRTSYSLDETMISNPQREMNKLCSSSFSSSASSSFNNSNLTSILKSSSNYDSDATISDGEGDGIGDSDDDGDSDNETVTSVEESGTSERRLLLGSYEKLNSLTVSIGKTRREEEIQVTYNRVMSNHRSVTKPKDVKYKRINKAKSRSLEELRGKLRVWDGKQNQALDMSGYQTQSFA